MHPGQVQSDPLRGAADRGAQDLRGGLGRRVAGMREVGVGAGGAALAPVGQVRGEQGPGAVRDADGFGCG